MLVRRVRAIPVDALLGQDRSLGWGELGARAEGAGGAFKGADVEFLELLP